MATGDTANIKKQRTVIRRLFTKSHNEIESLLHKTLQSNVKCELEAKIIFLNKTHDQLIALDQEIEEKLLKNPDWEENDLEKEIEDAETYNQKWRIIKEKVSEIQEKIMKSSHEEKNGKSSHHIKIETSTENKRNFKLPTLELKKFDGKLINWLPFWGQFNKIDKDESLDPEDKFQYLLQSTVPDTEVRKFIESFPPSEKSYNECIAELKSRYARDDILIQIYVRELLNIILDKKETNLISLYDKLSAQLRALNTLGVTKDKYSAFLLPMVESALPIETLKIWERNKRETKEQLPDLLEFLRKEVESEQRINMAKNAFQDDEQEHKTTSEPTAGCLMINNRAPKPKCVWCEKETHNSIECYKLQKMSIEQRRAMLKEKKACAICLKKGHHPKYCKAYVKCIICGQRHSVVLCTGLKQQEAKESGTSSTNHSTIQTEVPMMVIPETTNEEDSSTATNLSAGQKVKPGTTLLQTVSVIISNGQKQVNVRAMFDSGAQRSYLREDIARKLNIAPTGNEILSHTLFGGVEITSKQYNVYDLNVTSIDKKFTMKISALGQTCICRNIPKYTHADLSQILTKHKITLSDNSQTSEDIGLLIGADFSGLVLTRDMIQLHDSLVAIKTKLGWTLQGKIVDISSTQVQATSLAMFCSSEMSNFWSLETLGIRDPIEVKTKAQNEEEVLIAFEESVKINEEGRYEVLLPWKVGHDELFDNYDLASRRIQSVTKRLKSTGLYEGYKNVIDEWYDQGIIEIVPNPQKDLKTSHYLPHRPVIKEKSVTTKIRPVFDASAKDRQGKSLNLCLDKGVNLLEKIPKLLNGFRKEAFGVTADIAKAFLQVSVSPQDRDMLRFLWWDNKDTMITYRHCRVVFGLTSSPFLLSATIQHHLRQVTGDLKNTADILIDSFYVDNCLTSLDTIENVKKFKIESKEIMSQAKFDLRQWAIAPTAEGNKDDVVSVLGLRWHIAEDTLSCNIEDLPPACEIGKITKRNLLSLTQRIYDPIGFTTAVTLVPRLILQETWRRDLDWDMELPGDLKKKFITWYESLHNLQYCKIPRRLTMHHFIESSLQLHMFCDASQDGYAACVYLRAEYNNNISVRLVTAKSRVAPPEKLSIPRLELLAALIGSRLLVEARNDLKIECKEHCWTDSAVALYWIRKELPWNTYIGNRVKEIRQNTNTNTWSHISGVSNWADLASRGCDAAQLMSSRWLEGPMWLYSEPKEWPRSSLPMDETEARQELKKTAVCNTNLSTDGGMTNQLLYFSKYSKIIRTVAWMFRFVYNIRNKTKITGELSYEEFEQAEKRVIRLIQTENREYIGKKIQGITYFCDSDDGLIKIKTKLLLTADIPECTKFPAVLPATSCITRRLVLQRHQQLQHAGVATVMADLRARYWVIGARQLVKSVIISCNMCRRHRAKPVRAPTAPLPPERTQCSAPFEITGVDLAGPLYLRGGQKCWIVLFTCAVYRAVHLEITKSLSTEAFLMTLRRFIARRGRGNIIMSDNGTNFVGTNNLLADLDWNEIQRQSTIHRIRWKFNAPTAAWWGGFWERLIKILKDLLKRVLGKSTVTYEELETILCDCEAVMNGRPLTYVENDGTSSLEPLTPSCFLQPIPQTDVSDIDRIDSKSLNKRLRYIQKLRVDFRERFKTEYLTTLIQRGKEKKDSLKKGDIVLVETEEKRVKWPLGRIDEIFTGRDNIARTARVWTSTGYKVRPFQRLFKLEVSDPEIELPQQSMAEGGEPIPTTNRSPSRDVVDVKSFVPAEPDRLAEPDRPAEPDHQAESDLKKTTRSGRLTRLPSRYLI